MMGDVKDIVSARNKIPIKLTIPYLQLLALSSPSKFRMSPNDKLVFSDTSPQLNFKIALQLTIEQINV